MEEGPLTEEDHPLIMSICLRTPGMILNTANISSGHQATVDNRPKRTPLSDMFLMISYIALDMHMIFSQHYLSPVWECHIYRRPLLYYLLSFGGIQRHSGKAVRFISKFVRPDAEYDICYGSKRSHQHLLR